MKKLLLIYTLFIYGTLLAIAQPTVVKTEMRAVWLTVIGGIDWPRIEASNTANMQRQQQELCRILDQLKAANVNCVLMHTRVRASVIYPSQIEPWYEFLAGKTGRSPGYDALQFCIDECHKRGMQCHAWVVTIPVGKWNSATTKQLRQKMPQNIKKIGDEGFMNPERPETADYIAKICREITERYDVDGIHLDYIRYPENWKMTVSREQGRKNITHIVRTIHDAVKSVKPWVSRGWNAYTKVCQDAQGWLRDGLMDALFPMMYFKGDHFYPFAVDWQQHDSGRIVVAGLGTYMLDKGQQNWPLETMKREMYVLRSFGLGHAHFRSKFFTDNTKGIYDFTVQEFDRYPALVPPMTWESSEKPAAPAAVNVSGNTLTWSKVPAKQSYNVYNIYASETSPVNTEDPRNLIATRVTENSIQLPPSGFRHYAVTAIDRYGNEGPACQDAAVATVTKPQASLPHVDLLNVDGNYLTIPTGNETVEYLAVETMQGTIIATYPNATRIDISQLPKGYYLLKTLNAQGVAQRVGYFMK